MPFPKLETIADMGYVFACIQDRKPRGGTGYYDRTGHYKPVTNLGWLLRNSQDIHDLFVSTGRYKSLAMGGGPPFGRVNYGPEYGFDALLAARMTNGRVYVTTWQDRTILRDWLIRPKISGRLLHWECKSVIVGAPNYEEICT